MTLLAHLSFARPWWLLALLPLAFALWRMPAGTASWLRAVDAHLLPHVLTDGSGRRGGALAIAWLLAVLALAGPVLDGANGRDATRRDSLRVLVVDLSPEAAPELERIKLKLHALLARPHDGDTALLVYAAEPYLIVPPTSDSGVVARFIPELATDAMPAAGNRPDLALRMAASVLARSGAGTRDIVWFTASGWDGGLPELHDLRLSILHIGGFPQAAAKAAGGILTPMRADDSDLKLLDDTLRAGTRHARVAGESELGPWLLLPLLPLAALRFRRGLLAALPLLLCAGLLPDSAHAADAEARKLFDAGRYAEAAEAFSDPRWKAAAHYRAGRYDEAARLLEGRDDPDSMYNRANALARMGRLRDALAGYEAALRIRPSDADTLFNRDLVRSLLNGSKNGGKGGTDAPSASEAERAAEQWLRGVPDDPGTLLRRKLQAEHKRRLAGETERAW